MSLICPVSLICPMSLICPVSLICSVSLINKPETLLANFSLKFNDFVKPQRLVRRPYLRLLGSPCALITVCDHINPRLTLVILPNGWENIHTKNLIQIFIVTSDYCVSKKKLKDVYFFFSFFLIYDFVLINKMKYKKILSKYIFILYSALLCDNFVNEVPGINFKRISKYNFCLPYEN